MAAHDKAAFLKAASAHTHDTKQDKYNTLMGLTMGEQYQYKQ